MTLLLLAISTARSMAASVGLHARPSVPVTSASAPRSSASGTSVGSMKQSAYWCVSAWGAQTSGALTDGVSQF